MRILSNLPGRLRIGHGKLKNNHTMDETLDYLNHFDGIDSIIGSIITGNILIYYDFKIISESELISVIIKYSKPILQKNRKLKAHKGDRYWRDMLHAGMISSLIICTVSGFYGPKKIHLLTALLFIVVSAEHTRINRRLLFR